MTRVFITSGLACALLTTAVARGSQSANHLQPLDVARIVAERYPREMSLGYIPALVWSGSLRLSSLTGDDRWRQKARREMEPFISGEKAVVVPPYTLPGLSGYLALADLADADKTAPAAAQVRRAVDLVLPPGGDETIRFARGWTDDMFMSTALLVRAASRSEEDRYARATGRLLTTYAGRLQRPDGLFIHALEGPHAWGRGNGFAALGMIEALTHFPDSWKQRADVLDVYRRHMRALIAQQTDDGAWRQIVDDPGANKELTVTAMTVTALARGVRRGWLDRSFVPAIERGWRAVLTRVSPDGTLRDVCASTGAGATREYYLTRPVINGHDDRGAAMVLGAALEVHELGAIVNLQ